MFIILETREVLTHNFDKSETPMFQAAAQVHAIVGNHEAERTLRLWYRDMNRRLNDGIELWFELRPDEVKQLADLLDLDAAFSVLCRDSSESGKQKHFEIREAWLARVLAAETKISDPASGEAGENRFHLMNTASWISITRDFFLHAMEIGGTVAWFDPSTDTAEVMEWDSVPSSKL